MIAKCLVKLISKISKIEDLDILSLEPSLILPPLFNSISKEYFSEKIEHSDLNWTNGLAVIDVFLEENINSVLEYDIDALKQNDETMLIELICQLLAILSIFNSEIYDNNLFEMSPEEKKTVESVVKPFQDGLRKEITDIYLCYSLKDRRYLMKLIYDIKNFEEELAKKEDIIKELTIDKQTVENQFKILNNQITKREEDLNANDYIKDELVDELERKKLMVNMLQEENAVLESKLKNEEENVYKLDAEIGDLTNQLCEYKKRIENFINQEKYFKNKEKIYETTLNQLALYEEKANNYDKSVKASQEYKSFINILHDTNNKLKAQIKDQIKERTELDVKKKNLEKNNLELTARLNVLETELNELKKEKIIYQNHYKNLETQLFSNADAKKSQFPEKEDKDKVDVRDTKIKSLEADVNSLNEQLIEASGKIEEVRMGFKDEIDNLLNQIENLQNNISQLEMDLINEKSVNEKLQKVLEGKGIDTTNIRNSSMEQKIKELEQKNKDLEKQLTGKDDQIAFLNKNNDELQTHLKRRTSSVIFKDLPIQDEQIEVEQPKSSENTSDDIERVRIDLHQKKLLLDKFQKETEELREDLKKKEKILSDLQNMLNKSENEKVYLDEDKKNLLKEIEDLKQKNNNLKSKVDELRKKTSLLMIGQDSKEGNKEVIENIKNDLLKKEKEIQDLENENENLNTEKKNLLNELTTSKIQSENFKNEKKNIMNELTTLKEELDTFKKERKITDDIEKEKKIMLNQINNLNEQITNLKKKELELNNYIKNVETKSQNDKDKQSLEDQLKILQNNYQLIIKDKETAKDEINELKKKIKILENEKSVLMEEIKKMQNLNQKFKIEKEELRLTVKKIQRDLDEETKKDKEKIIYKTEEKIIEKFVPISQEEFEYKNNQLLYSVFMSYYKDYLKIDDMIVKRNQDTKRNLTTRFALGKLLKD